jgi:hypothetical protein
MSPRSDRIGMFTEEGAALAGIPRLPRSVLGETLHSLFVRYHALSAHATVRVTNLALLGRPALQHGLLYVGLQQLVERFASSTTLSAEQLIVEHTLVPMYQAVWRPSEYWAAIHRILRYETPSELAFSMQGLIASHLRMCPACRDRDEELLGIGTWKLAHHIPGVTVCAEHRLCLIAQCPHCGCSVAPGNSLSPPPRTCRQCGYAYDREELASESYDRFAIELSVLTQSCLVDPLLFKRGVLDGTLRRQLRELRLCGVRGRPNQGAIIDWLASKIPREFVRNNEWAASRRLLRALQDFSSDRRRPQQVRPILVLALCLFDGSEAFRRAYDARYRGEDRASASGGLQPSLSTYGPIRMIRSRSATQALDGNAHDADVARRIEEVAPRLYKVVGRKRRITRNSLRLAAGVSARAYGATGSLTDTALRRWTEARANWHEHQLFEAAWRLTRSGVRLSPTKLCKAARIHESRKSVAQAFMNEYPDLVG